MKTTTKEFANSVEAFDDYFKTNDIIFYKREMDGEIILYLLPYRIMKKYRIDINLFVFSDSPFCRMFFKCPLNTKKDCSKRILEINSEMDSGSLSIEPNSNTITFRIDFNISSYSKIDSIYEAKLYACFLVYEKLFKENIIKVDAANEE